MMSASFSTNLSIPTLAEASVLNNQGVALLSAGKPREAIGVLKRSLATFHNILRTATRFDSSDTAAAPPCSITTRKCWNDLSTLSCVPFLEGGTQENDDEDSLYHLYGSAIAFDVCNQPSQEEQYQLNEVDVTFYTASAMLNLGLAGHLLGQMLFFSTGATSWLKKADHLYQGIQRVVDVAVREEQRMQGLSFLSLAAQNNRLGIALQLGSNRSSEDVGSMNQLKQRLDVLIKVTNACYASSPHQQEENGSVSYLVEHMYINEFRLNSAILDMTSMFMTMAASSA